MDGSSFDTLARAIARGGTRRRAVALLLGLPLGSALAIAAEEGPVAAERPTDRLHRRTQHRNRKQRNKSKNKNNKGGGNRAQNPDNKPCSSAADCKGQVCCDGACCKPPANQCNLAGLCCAPNCDNRQCGPDGCGQGGTCGSCGVCQRCTDEGTCEPLPNGTVCGTSSHGGGTIRCCNGTCPDPDCVPVGVERDGCPGPCGENGANCCSFPGEGGGGFCLGSPPNRCFCTIFGFPGMRCGSDHECELSGLDITACICGTCQLPPS